MLTSEPSEQESTDQQQTKLLDEFTDKQRHILQQVLEGFTLSTGTEVTCTVCQQSISEGSVVTTYAYRPCEDPVWSVPRTYCKADRPAIIGTLGIWDAIAHARVGTLSDAATQSHTPVLVEPTVEHMSPPTQGTRPYPTITTEAGQ